VASESVPFGQGALRKDAKSLEKEIGWFRLIDLPRHLVKRKKGPIDRTLLPGIRWEKGNTKGGVRRGTPGGRDGLAGISFRFNGFLSRELGGSAGCGRGSAINGEKQRVIKRESSEGA